MKLSSRAFTLIELLVVIAIIGILSSVVLASLNTARLKSRDARRLSDLKQMASQIQLTDKDPAQGFTTALGAAVYGASASALVTPDLRNFKDPLTPGTVCTKSSSVACNYMVGKHDGSAGQPTTQDYEICAYLEGPAGSLAGLQMIRIGSDTSGSPVAGCN